MSAVKMFLMITAVATLSAISTSATSHEHSPQIPSQFQGRWSENCEDDESTSNLVIEPSYIYYYESSGPIRAVVKQGEFEVALISELSGEGEVWLSFTKFRLTGGNANLIDVTDDEQHFVRYRCRS